MRNQLTFIFILITRITFAQWSTLTTPATDDLNDLDFLNANYGVITGNGGTLLLTVNGGASWTDISGSISMHDIYGVKVFNEDTFIVSTFDINTASGIIYMTVNGGSSWVQIGTDGGMNHEIDLESISNSTLWALGGNLYHSGNFGASWDTSFYNTAGTSSYDVITFADAQTAHISGLVSGFTTYSAVFSRSDDGGLSWFPGDVFSFPNDDAFTAMCFVNADTAMYFMNEYSGFMPSSVNKLIKIHSFSKVSPFPGDTLFTFTSVNVNSSMPAYINDAYFMNSENGIALGDDGNVYRTINGGATWNIDFSVAVSLNKLVVMDSVIYAVGNNGTVIKYDGVASVDASGNSYSILLFPNPVESVLTICTEGATLYNARVYSMEGQLTDEIQFNSNYKYSVEKFADGLYIMVLSSEEGSVRKKFLKY